MSLRPTLRLVIDPQLRLKSDVDRVLLITRPSPYSSTATFCHFVHPTEALILALFDGDHTIEDVRHLWADLSGKTLETCHQEVDDLINYYSQLNDGKGIFVEVDEEADKKNLLRYEPMDFIMSKERVNLTDWRLRRPYIIYYIPSLFCPQKCIYCYAKVRRSVENNLIDLGRLREIFLELSAIGVETIGLSGGDPLARRDILKIIRSMVEVGIIPYVPTKVGLSLRRIEELRAMGVWLMQVSCDSADPGTIDRMVGIPGYHKRLFRVMKNLVRSGMKIRVNAVLTPINLPTIGGLIDYLGNLRSVEEIHLSPYARSMFCHQDELFIEHRHLEELHKIVAERKVLYKHMKIVLGGLPPPAFADESIRQRIWKERALCSANRYGFVMLPDGRVTVCEELYDHPTYIIGDLTKQSVMELWNSPEAQALRYPDQAAVPEGPCKTCDSFVQCTTGRGRCYRDIIKTYGWNKPHYPDPRCPLAPASGVRLV